MQPVTETYSPYEADRWSDVRVTYQLIDVDAAENTTATSSAEAAVSKLAQTHNKMTSMAQKLASLETNYFLLDGAYLLPDETENDEVGFWSEEISNANGEFSLEPYLIFTFSANHTSKGFTVIFDDKSEEYAEDFVIETFDHSDMLMEQRVITGNSNPHCVIDMPTVDYRKVKLTFTKTSKPFRRIRICEFVFGFLQHFRSNDISNLNILFETSLTSEKLPSNQVIITLGNTNRQYNILNPSGIFKFLQQGQGINVQVGVGKQDDIQMINMGRYYFESAASNDEAMTAEILGYDRMFLLGKSICRIGETGTWTLEEAVDAVLGSAGVMITTVIPAEIGSRIIKKCIPQNTNHREALRLIAQAGRSTCYMNRSDELEFAELIVGEARDVLTYDKQLKPAKTKDIGRINKVEVISKDQYSGIETIYSATNKTGDESEIVKTITNPLANGNDVATWILNCYLNRYEYQIQERGNPAIELGDAITIYDFYGEDKDSVVINQAFKYDGTLSAQAKAMGGA